MFVYGPSKLKYLKFQRKKIKVKSKQISKNQLVEANVPQV